MSHVTAVADVANPVCGMTIGVGSDALAKFLQLAFDYIGFQNGSVGLEDRGSLGIQTTFVDETGTAWYLADESLQGGTLTLTSLQVESASQSAPSSNVINVQLSLSGNVTFDKYGENSCQSGWGESPSWSYYPALTFVIQSITINCQVVMTCNPPSDPYETVGTWGLVVQNSSQSATTVVNFVPPGKTILSELAKSDRWDSCLDQNIYPQFEQDITSSDFAGYFQKAVNARFEAYPDSGLLTTGTYFCFGLADLIWPASGGFQAAISGLFVANGTRYSEMPQAALSYPTPIQSNGIAFCFGAYEVDAILWGIDQLGKFSGEWNAQNTGDESTYLTTTYQGDLPELYNFAPDIQFTMNVSTTGSTNNTSAPTASISFIWVVTPGYVEYGSKNVPSSVTQNLQSIQGIVFTDQNAISAELGQILTASDYNTYSNSIISDIMANGLLGSASIDVTLTAMIQGVSTTLVSVAILLVFAAGNFNVCSVDGPAGSGTINQLQFDFDVISHSVGTPTTAWAGGFLTSANTWYNQLLSIHVTDFIKSLQIPNASPGMCGVSLPTLPDIVVESLGLGISASDGTITLYTVITS